MAKYSNNAQNMIFFYLRLIFLLLLQTLVTKSDKLVIVYDSRENDGFFQTQLVKGSFMGLRDSYEGSIRPQFINLATQPHGKFSHFFNTPTNEKLVLLSILSTHQLHNLAKKLKFESNSSVVIITPRRAQISTKLQNVKFYSLQMSENATVFGLLNRMSRVKLSSITPVLDSENQLIILENYKNIARTYFKELRFEEPSWVPSSNISEFENGLIEETQSANHSRGVLVLSKWTPNLHSLEKREYLYRWFLNEPLYESGKNVQQLLGLYNLQFVGSGNWDNPKRRTMLREFNEYTGPSPIIISLVLAYDSSIVAKKILESSDENLVDLKIEGLSGSISFTKNGYRAEGGILGLSTLPNSTSSGFLNPSEYMVEDVLFLSENENELKIAQYHMATSSVLSRTDLMNLAKKGEAKWECAKMELIVTTHDPFSQLHYKYIFESDTLVDNLLIPNEYGYGLTFSCHSSDALVSTIQIACSPTGGSIGSSVQCYKSRLRTRDKRSEEYRRMMSSPYSRVMNSPMDKDDNYLMPPPPLMDNYYSYNSGSDNSSGDGGNMMMMDMEMETTTEGTTTASTPPPPPPAPKLPPLRSILKAVKPFVGACIGATTGCSVCVLVLSRLPLGAVPAACTGPCFVGTFGNCGGLLGRTFAETTVVCTELFRQGELDVGTFLADAQLGRHLAKHEPITLEGYQFLAAPVVSQMRKSEKFTQIVSYIASPWAKYMKYLMGHSEEYSRVGHWLHVFGSPFCTLVGYGLKLSHQIKTKASSYAQGAQKYLNIFS